MKRKDVFQYIQSFDLDEFYVRKVGDDDYEIFFGDDIKKVVSNQQQMEIDLLRSQLRYAMAVAYGVPFDKAEELII